MAGLLELLNTDQGRMGLGLLAAAGPRSDGAGFGQRLQEGMGYVQAQQDNDMKRKFQQAQMDNYASEIEARKLATIKDARQQKYMEAIFGIPDGSQPTQQVAPASLLGGNAPTMPVQKPQTQNGIIGMAQKLGIPPEAIQTDFIFNGGKKISEMLADRSKPNWQNINGNLVNTNLQGFEGGFQPGMSSSADGKVTAWQPDGKGGLVVGAPSGAVDTFRAYQGAAAESKPIKVYNPATGRDEYVSENAVLGGGRKTSLPTGYANEGQMSATVSGDMGADPSALAREIRQTQNDLMKPLDANSKAMLKDHLSSLLAQSGKIGAAQSGNYAAGPSLEEAAKAKATEAKLVGTAEADVVRDTGRKKEAKLQDQLTAGLDRAISLLEEGPTSSGAGALMDSAVGFFGGSTQGADLASQLDTISGWLTANVPRMEGPQSNIDVQNYRIQAANVGDRTKPISQRLSAAKELKGLKEKYSALNGNDAQANSADAPGGAQPPKTATLADIQATARASGRSTEEVTRALRAKGYTIGGM